MTILLMLLIVSMHSFSQESIIGEVDEPLINKYYALALQHYPLKKASDATVERSKAQVSIATMGIFDVFNAGYFYSPQQNKGLVLIPGGGANGTNNIVNSGFQFGVNLNLGNVFSKPSVIKAAKADHKVAVAQNQEYINNLALLVKSSYYDFIAAKKQLEIASLAAKDLSSILSNAQKQFQDGIITIDIYTIAKSASTTAEVSVLTSEVTYLKAKNVLENIIGKKLEEVR